MPIKNCANVCSHSACKASPSTQHTKTKIYCWIKKCSFRWRPVKCLLFSSSIPFSMQHSQCMRIRELRNFGRTGMGTIRTMFQMLILTSHIISNGLFLFFNHQNSHSKIVRHLNYGINEFWFNLKDQECPRKLVTQLLELKLYLGLNEMRRNMGNSNIFYWCLTIWRFSRWKHLQKISLILPKAMNQGSIAMNQGSKCVSNYTQYQSPYVSIQQSK